MSYTESMSATTNIVDDCEATINVSQLVLAIRELGFDEVDVVNVDSGYSLTVAGVTVATGIGDTPLEASEELLDRAAELFYYNVPTL